MSNTPYSSNELQSRVKQLNIHNTRLVFNILYQYVITSILNTTITDIDLAVVSFYSIVHIYYDTRKAKRTFAQEEDGVGNQFKAHNQN